MRHLSSAAIDPPAAAPAGLSPFSLVSLSLSACLLLLSAVSLLLILHLRLQSRRRPHLSAFTPLLPLRLTLTTLASIWSLHESLILRPTFLHPSLCNLHVIISLGLLQPGFLITILFLVHLSIKKSPVRGAFRSIFISLLPALALQIVSVAFLSPPPFRSHLPHIFRYSASVPTPDSSYLCTYPFFSTIGFAAFAVAYCLGFLFTYLRVTRLVINKGTRARIHVLAFTLLICIPLQVLLLAASSHWGPGDVAYDFIAVGMFAAVAFCAAVGEGILVIKPITDALSAGGVGVAYGRTREVERPIGAGAFRSFY